MKKSGVILNLILISILFLPTCCSEEKSVPAVAYTLEEKDLIPEGIAYDPVTAQLFVSSIGKEKIIAISREGKVSDFVATGQDSIMQTLGMKVDQDDRRLWVVSNKVIDNITYSAVHIYNIDSKSLIKKIICRDTVRQLFNDLALTNEGDAFISDSYGSKIYRLDSDLGQIELFAGSDSLLRSVNGIAVSPDDKILYAATGAFIAVIDKDSKNIKPISDPNDIGSNGVDGIVFYNGSLIGVMNSKDTESEMFVARYELSSDLMEITARTILDKGNPLFNMPTTCTLAGDELYYLGNTSLRLYFRDKNNEKGLFQNPLIMKYKLDN